MKEIDEWLVVGSLLTNAQGKLQSARTQLTAHMVGAHAGVLGCVLERLDRELSMHIQFCQEKVQNLDQHAPKK